MDDDALVAAAAAAAASCVRTLDFAPWAALLVIPSDGLSPLVFGMPAETAPEYELSTDVCDELGFLEPENAAHDELVDRVDGTDDAAYTTRPSSPAPPSSSTGMWASPIPASPLSRSPAACSGVGTASRSPRTTASGRQSPTAGHGE